MYIDNFIKGETHMRYPNGFYQMDSRIFDRDSSRLHSRSKTFLLLVPEVGEAASRR